MDDKNVFLIKSSCIEDEKFYINEKNEIFNSKNKIVKKVRLKGIGKYKKLRPLPELIAAAFLNYEIGLSEIGIHVGFRDEDETNLSPKNLKFHYIPNCYLTPSKIHDNFLVNKYLFTEYDSDDEMILVDYSSGFKEIKNTDSKSPEFWEIKKELEAKRELLINEKREAIKTIVKDAVKSNEIDVDINKAQREIFILKTKKGIIKYNIKNEELF